MSQPALKNPYLLVLFSVPCMRNANNALCISLAWAKDLIEHTKYIEKLTLISYFSDETPLADAVEIEHNPGLKNVRFVMIPKPSNTLHALRMLPKTISIIWHEISKAQIVHSAVAGWPIPEAWIICPMLVFKRRFHFINVESAFWRIPKGQTGSIKQKIRAAICERLNKWCVQSADLSTFTQDAYKNTLLGKQQHKGFVIPATWIDADNIVKPELLAGLIQSKSAQINKPIKLVFAGRLVLEKGILLLIQAVSELLDQGYLLSLDIIGDGALLRECEQLIQANKKQSSIKMLGTVQYGPDFFSLLHGYDLMVIPSLSDEQPRNVFDAFSQGLPVLCADTAGLMQCVDQKTGYFFKTGDIESLKNQLIEIMQNRQALVNLSSACVDAVSNMTHKKMHEKRLEILNQALAKYGANA
ncbi:MAG: glycosyltransferase [Pseudomonadota bacterium]